VLVVLLLEFLNYFAAVFLVLELGCVGFLVGDRFCRLGGLLVDGLVFFGSAD
jgi:hypothetical protein